MNATNALIDAMTANVRAKRSDSTSWEVVTLRDAVGGVWTIAE